MAKPIVSIFVHCYPPAKGGIEFLTSKIKQILDPNYKVHIFCGKGLTLDSYKNFSGFTNQKSKNIHRLSILKLKQKLNNKILSNFINKFPVFAHLYFGPNLKYNRKHQNIIKKSQFILGLAMPTKSFVDAYHFAKLYQKKLILIPAYHNRPYYNHNPFFQKAFDLANKIILLSPKEKKYLFQNYRIQSNKTILVTFSPYTLKQIKSIKPKKPLKILTFGFVGQISYRKNLSYFSKIIPPNSKLLLAGAKTNQSTQLIKQLKKKIPHLKLVYNFKNKSKIYSQIDLFVNPSFEESFGIVNLEALYHGLPIIVHPRSPFFQILKAYKVPNFPKNIKQQINFLKVPQNYQNTFNIQRQIFQQYNLDNFKKQILQCLA